jgi:hypothetical protein
MNELLKILLNTIIIAEFIPVVIGVYNYKKIKDTYWIWFLCYLAFIFCAELLSDLEILFNASNRKYIYGFLIIPIEFLFFYWLYACKSLKNKKLFWTFAMVYLVSFIPHLYLKSENTMVYSFNYVVGAFLLGILVFLEYLKQIRSDEILKFKENMMFYVNLGVSLLYVGTLPLFSFYVIIIKDKEIFTNYNILFLLINQLMYLLFSMAFLWGKPNTY